MKPGLGRGFIPAPRSDEACRANRVGLHLAACACLGFAFPSPAWNPPDTAELLSAFRVLEREAGKPALLAQSAGKKKQDSLYLRLIWQEGRIVEARYQQNRPFDPDAFLPLASQYGGGGGWHELPDPAPQSLEAKTYPGIVQQWQLEGYGGASGWSGAGVVGERFFVVFRSEALTRNAAPHAPLALRTDLSSCLDTLSQWLQVSCPTGWPGIPALATCYSPVDNPRRHVVRLPLSKKGSAPAVPTFVVLWQEGEGLHDVFEAMRTLPAGEEAGYAEDLSRILGGEARTFLSQVAAANPCLFDQPSWAVARVQGGHVPPRQYQGYLGAHAKATDGLPALQLGLPACSLSVTIAKGGAYRLNAFVKTPAAVNPP